MVRIIRAFAVAMLAVSAMAHPAMEVTAGFARAKAAKGGAWSPEMLGDALAVWFDAADNSTVLNTSGLPCGDGDDVATWLDKSGNGRDAYRTPIAPVYKIGTQNNLPVISQKSSGSLASLVVFSASDVMRGRGAGYIFAVAHDTNPTGGQTIHCVASFPFVKTTLQTTRLAAFTRNEYTGGAVLQANSRRRDTDLQRAADIPHMGQIALMQCFGDWANGYIRLAVNGGAYVSTALSGGAGLTDDTSNYSLAIMGLEDGGFLPYDSVIAEIIICNQALTEAQITQTQTYLMQKWGITP